MSDESKTNDEALKEWQALMNEVFEGFEPLFEATFVKGTANERRRFKMLYKTTGFIEEIKDGVSYCVEKDVCCCCFLNDFSVALPFSCNSLFFIVPDTFFVDYLLHLLCIKCHQL